MELPSEHGQHVHSGMRFSFEKDLDIVTVNFDTNGLFESDRVGLMRSLVQHGGKTEELAWTGFIHDDFLLVLIDGGDPHPSAHHDVGSSARVTHFVNSLVWSELPDFHLSGQHCCLFVIQ
jgi:hypothetical protein